MVVESTGEKWGVFIDIFVIDGLSDSMKEAEKLMKRTRQIRRFVSNQRYTCKMKLSLEYGLSKNIAICFGKFLHPFVSMGAFMRKMIKLSNMYDYDNSKYVAPLSGIPQIIYERKLFSEIIEVPFEDRKYLTP